jgi:recombination protein RecA
MSLKEELLKIEKQFGKGSVFCLGDKEIVKVEAISTGCYSLDRAIGVGGFPKGRVVEIFGPESSGKTTVALQTIAGAQAMGSRGAIIDAEHALDLAYAKNLGVKTDELIVSQPDYGEQALEIAERLVRSGEVGIIVVDSVAALVPRAELEGEMGDSHMGLQARMMSQALRKLTGIVHKSDCCLVFINQLRDKIGVMFGNNETTTGGKALKFYSSLRLDIRRISTIKLNEEPIGSRTRIKMVKNKLSKPFGIAEVDMLFGMGISKEADILDCAVQRGLVDKSGSWMSFGEERLGQGREQVCTLLRTNKELYERLSAEVRNYDLYNQK